MVQFDMLPRDDEDGSCDRSYSIIPLRRRCIPLFNSMHHSQPNRRSLEANALLYDLSEVRWYATDGTNTFESTGSKLGFYFEFRRSIIGRESDRGPHGRFSKVQ